MDALRFDLTVMRGALRHKLKVVNEIMREAKPDNMGLDTIIRLLSAGYLG